MPAFDANLMFRTSGSLTASASFGPLTVRGTPVTGLACRIVVPSAPGAADTLKATIYGSADASTYHALASSPVTVIGVAGKELFVPVHGQYKYYKLELIITATTPATGFGVVKAGLVEQVGHDWTRAVNWD